MHAAPRSRRFQYEYRRRMLCSPTINPWTARNLTDPCPCSRDSPARHLYDRSQPSRTLLTNRKSSRGHLSRPMTRRKRRRRTRAPPRCAMPSSAGLGPSASSWTATAPCAHTAHSPPAGSPRAPATTSPPSAASLRICSGGRPTASTPSATRRSRPPRTSYNHVNPLYHSRNILPTAGSTCDKEVLPVPHVNTFLRLPH
jgi:hypothetical protein